MKRASAYVHWVSSHLNSFHFLHGLRKRASLCSYITLTVRIPVGIRCLYCAFLTGFVHQFVN